MKTIKIKSIHKTLAEAVAAAKLDLSYNPKEGARSVAALDNPHPRGSVKEAFVTEDGRVLFLYQCDILLLNDFEPFHSVIDDCPFYVVNIERDLKEIKIITEAPFPRSTRKILSKSSLPVTTLTH